LKKTAAILLSLIFMLSLISCQAVNDFGESIFEPIPNADSFTKTGEGRYNYQFLTDGQKYAYNAMLDAAFDMKEGAFAVGKIELSELNMVYQVFKDDHPELFWMPNNYHYTQRSTGSVKVAFSLDAGADSVDYLYDKETCDNMLDEVNLAIEDFNSHITPDMDEYEIERTLYNLLAQRTEYNKAAVSDPKDHPEAYNIYGALVSKSAVCEGYARAFQLLLRKNDMQSTICYGTSNREEYRDMDVGHAWNVVRVNGEWYHADVTWDSSANQERNMHIYFNLPDHDILADHVIGKDYAVTGEYVPGENYNFHLPECDSETYSYTAINGTEVDSLQELYDAATLELEQNAPLGKTEYLFVFSKDSGIGMDQLDEQELMENLTECARQANTRIFDERISQIQQIGMGRRVHLSIVMGD